MARSGGSMGTMRPRSSFIAYSRIPPAVLLRFPRHLAPALALNLPLTASLVNRSRSWDPDLCTNVFDGSLQKSTEKRSKISVHQAMKWKIVREIEVCSSLNRVQFATIPCEILWDSPFRFQGKFDLRAGTLRWFDARIPSSSWEIYVGFTVLTSYFPHFHRCKFNIYSFNCKW